MALLGPYLAKAGAAVAAQLGQEVWGRFRVAIEKLYSHVKKKFATNPRAKDALSRLEQDPQLQQRQTEVVKLLSQFIEDDPHFAQELGELVKAARQASGDTIIQTVNVSGGSVGNIKQIGKIEGHD